MAIEGRTHHHHAQARERAGDTEQPRIEAASDVVQSRCLA
jgi:hypothetical protein